MSLCHKAFAFDWPAFQHDDLYDLLGAALETNDASLLREYIETHRSLLQHPDEGGSLGDDWETNLEVRDIHQLGDFALTRFYDPRGDFGVHEFWQNIDERLPDKGKAALLGFSFCRADKHFDPGRLGSYFQTPDQVRSNLALLLQFGSLVQASQRDLFEMFLAGLEDCVSASLGLYVTF